MAKINSSVSEVNDFAFKGSDDFLLRGIDDGATSKVSNGKKSNDPEPTAEVIENADLAHYGALLADGELADAAAFNLNWDKDPDSFTSGLPGLLHDPNEYSLLRDKPVFGLTGDWDPTTPGVQNVRNQIDIGTNLAGSDDGVITWGFYDFHRKLGPNSNGEHKAFFPFTDAQKAAAVQSIQSWDDLIAPEFQLVDFNEHDARQWAQGDAPDILMANTLSGPAQAWAYYPTSGGNGAWHRSASDVWIGASADNRSDLFDGGYGLHTQVHELGHSLGLSHPGNYNFGDDEDGDGIPDPITYEGDAFYWQDSRQYSVMSYFDAYETGSNVIDWNLMRVMHASTPMVHDIWIVQQKYGADTTTRDGDSTYGFNWSADVTNTAMQFVDDADGVGGERMTIFSIWDADGNDTLDLSGYYTPSIIDLREGAYSSAGGLGAYNPAWVGVTPDDDLDAYLAFVNANNAALGLASRTAALDLYFGGRPGVNEDVPWSDIVGRDWLMENNIGIAYGATIENAIGGHGNDRINGNQVDNQFTGNAGADTFIIADYSGETLDGQEFDDESVDTIMDFVSGVDRIDLSELGVEWADLSVVGNTWTVERGADDLSFVVLGSTAVQSDFHFG
jgi:serralysin